MNQLYHSLLFFANVFMKPAKQLNSSTKVILIKINKEQYSPNEKIMLTILNAEGRTGKKYFEIIDLEYQSINIEMKLMIFLKK